MTPEEAEQMRREDEYWIMREREELEQAQRPDNDASRPDNWRQTFRNNPDHDDSYMNTRSEPEQDEDELG